MGRSQVRWRRLGKAEGGGQRRRSERMAREKVVRGRAEAAVATWRRSWVMVVKEEVRRKGSGEVVVRGSSSQELVVKGRK